MATCRKKHFRKYKKKKKYFGCWRPFLAKRSEEIKKRPPSVEATQQSEFFVVAGPGIEPGTS